MESKQEKCPPDGKPVLGARSGCDSLVGWARLLRCESSEDGDGRRLDVSYLNHSGKKPESLRYAVNHIDFSLKDVL